MDLFYYRECAVKFNDYFEFPREIDMEPFTEIGLAKTEGISFYFHHIDISFYTVGYGLLRALKTT